MHVSQYESLKDPTCTWLENWLMHEYTECYLYYSMMQDETDAAIERIWQEHFEMEVSHLKRVAELLKQYESKEVSAVIPVPEFPDLLKKIIEEEVYITSDGEKYKDAHKLPKDADFLSTTTRLI